MNLTLISLSLSNYYKNSPFFTSFIGSKSHISFNNILANKFLNSFYKSENPFVKIISSKFQYFLDNAIYIDSSHTEMKAIRHFDKTFSSPQDMSIETYSIFSKCCFLTILNLKKGATGGALYYTSYIGHVELNNCQFQWCFALQRAGAFLISSKRLHASSLCIFQCSAGRSIQAFQITTNSNKGRANLTTSIITNCGPLQWKNEKEQMRFESVSLDFIDTNVTRNRRLFSGMIHFSKLYDAAINYCEFHENSGPNLFVLSNSYDVYLAFSNIIGNDVGFQPLIQSKASSMFITHSSFLRNININNETTFSVDLESDMKIIFGNCTFDIPKENMHFNSFLIQIRKSRFNTTDAVMHTFQNTRECEFYVYPAQTTPPRTATKKKTHVIVYVPEPTIDWFPQHLVHEQYALFVVIFITLPVLVYAFLTKKKTFEIQALDG